MILKEKARDALCFYNQCLLSPIDDIHTKLARRMSEIFMYQDGNLSSSYFKITEDFFLEEISKRHAHFFDVMPYAIFFLFEKAGNNSFSLQDKIEEAGMTLDFYDLQIGTERETSSKLHRGVSFANNCMRIAQILSFMLNQDMMLFDCKDIDNVYHFYFYKRLRMKYQLESGSITAFDVCCFDFRDIDLWVVKHFLLHKFSSNDIIETLYTYSLGYFFSRNPSYGYLVFFDALGIDSFIE